MKNQIKKAFTAFSVYGITALSTVSAKAAMIDPNDQPTDVMSGDFRTNIVSIINYILGFLGLITVAFIIYAGFLMVTAGGEDDNLTKGKGIITWAAAGIIIILLSYGIVNVIIGAGNNAAT